MQDRVTVAVDEDLSDLILGFLQRKHGDCNAILQAVPIRDYDSVLRIAHRIKGEGGSYGFDAMTEIGRSIEQAAALGDDRSVIRLVAELLSYLERVDVVFQPSAD
jgi:HPt (histidine-containing phosphotransfer) domain-containing protein